MFNRPIYSYDKLAYSLVRVSLQLQYHLYHPALPHLTPPHLNAHQHIMQTFFMSPTIREELQRKQEACYPPSVMAANHRDILLNDRYWGLIPLDKAPPNANSSQHHANNSNISMRLYGWRSWMFRVMNDRDGKLYAIRRMEGGLGDLFHYTS
jgi:PAB-dependent poly(A)-specific ribonuclease subunit 3